MQSPAVSTYYLKGSSATVYYAYYDNWRYETTTGEFHIVFD